MRVLSAPGEVWYGELTCDRCDTVFQADHDDLQSDKFKAPGTYWFDGTGDASATEKIHVQCPKCNICIFVPHSEVPFLLRQKLLRNP